MGGVNKAIIIGRLGKEPDIKVMPNGNHVANLTVATSEKWKDQQGQQQESTEWHRITIYGKLAEIAGQYLQKGSQAYFEGKITTRKWQDNNGQDRYTTEIVANTMQMLDSKGEGKPQGYQNQPNPTYGKAQQAQQPQAPSGDMDFDDSIPF